MNNYSNFNKKMPVPYSTFRIDRISISFSYSFINTRQTTYSVKKIKKQRGLRNPERTKN